VIKYIGSKRALMPALLDVFDALGEARTVLDLFSGTSRVGHALKRRGHRVLANDHNAYAATLARCYVQADHEELAVVAAREIARLDALPGQPGYFTHTFCEESRFFRPENGARVDAIRDAIAALSAPPELEAVLLTSLMEAADRVDSTTGLQMAYLKQWAKRAHNPLSLRLPELLPRATAGKGEAHALDVLEAATKLEGDVAYLDPPYNQHKYLGNYHVWETLVRWDAPEYYGVACKRVDCRDRRSDFNSRPRHEAALEQLIERVRARTLVVSMSDEGYVTRATMERMLARRGEVVTLAVDYKRYVGAQIGIHALSGEKVGEVGALRNREYIFVAGEGVERVRDLSAPRPKSADQERDPQTEIKWL